MTSKYRWINKSIQNTILVSEIHYNNLESSQNDCTTLKNYRQIASYSWSSKSCTQKPLIYIPVDNKASESFIIDLQKIGDLILMLRREKSSRVYNDTFGDDFENMVSLSNDDYNGHRIIASYGFGNHQFLVRFEVDCVEEKQETLNENIPDQKARSFKKEIKKNLIMKKNN
ncbi:hypothetical protein BpHYR1_024330 [Brachionus plicatilis]|uniref:Uncharacterized protein n=1 Tax=Brachionus plicatilis TaxID=10195 RepID=A0A3M7QB77_BRAPC|nr:hypothetical protein BpHYR1_024330 [Brachionus plicatilis]